MSADVLGDLAAERAHLDLSRRCRLAMIADFERVLSGETAADDITQEYIEMTAARALQDLADPVTAEFFGRIDATTGESFHIGRRHIETERHDPVVVDWRASIAAPFYRATVSDAFGLVLRRRFTLRDGAVISYNDEHLDDPDGAEVAGGIPDPVLAEMGAARTGAMREIVATIQGEQDVVIRSPAAIALIVQGGPGTGKTAVGLHRAAYLLFEQRRRLEREGVLVVGPNQVFLAYIADVLPSLGERAVEQRTLRELLVPKVPADHHDADEVAALKGDLRLANVIERAALARVRPPTGAIRLPLGTRTLTVEPATIADWIGRALNSSSPLHARRTGLRALARNELMRLTGREDAWTRAEPLRKALDAAWPTIRPIELVERLLRRPDVLAAAADGVLDDDEQAMLVSSGGRRHRWSVADSVLVDEAKGLLDGPARIYGHVVVDEAQDLSGMALRAIARRCPSHSLTILGDLAQSTAPGGQRAWADALISLGSPPSAVAQLTIGYRVPAPILAFANTLLDRAEVTVPASRSARLDGAEPTLCVVAAADIATRAAAEVLALRTRHRLSGAIAPAGLVAAVAAAVSDAGMEPVDHLDHLGERQVPVLAAEDCKGLELDGVVAVEPGLLVADGSRGARLAYIVLTRAVQELTIVASSGWPVDNQ